MKQSGFDICVASIQTENPIPKPMNLQARVTADDGVGALKLIADFLIADFATATQDRSSRQTSDWSSWRTAFEQGFCRLGAAYAHDRLCCSTDYGKQGLAWRPRPAEASEQRYDDRAGGVAGRVRQAPE